MNVCNQNHPAISWESSDSISCPMCMLMEEHQSDLAIQERKYDEDFEDLKQDAARWEDKASDLESEVRDLESQVSSLESEVSSLEDEVSGLQDQIAELETKQ